MEFSYYYGNQADQFSFIRIPRVLLVDPLFSPLTIQAKLLYGVLLDRMGISMRNGWFDELNRVYIIYQISEIQEDLGFSKKKAIDYLTELETFGLVEKKRRGRGLPSILYIKSFMTAQAAMPVPKVTVGSEVRGAETDTSGIVSQEIRSAENDTSRGYEIALQEDPESTLLEVPKSTPLMNNNNKNNTHVSYVIREVPLLENPITVNPATGKPMPDIPITGSPMTDNPTELSKKEKRTDELNTDCINNSSNQIRADPWEEADRMRLDRELYRNLIKSNIEYDILSQNWRDREEIDELIEIMLDVVCSTKPMIVVRGQEMPTEVVKSRLLKLNSEHIQYVLGCLRSNTVKARNIKQYLLAALYNAPSTINTYYTNLVNHDLYGGG